MTDRAQATGGDDWPVVVMVTVIVAAIAGYAVLQAVSGRPGLASHAQHVTAVCNGVFGCGGPSVHALGGILLVSAFVVGAVGVLAYERQVRRG